jgi:hypothetical protein
VSRPRVLLQQHTFSGGLNTAADEASVGEDQLRRADNCRLIDRGAVTKRLGMQRLHASALPATIRGGFCWRRAASTQLLAVSNGALYTGTYGLPMTWTAQVGALAASATPSFAAFRDGSGECVYVADGGPLNKWDGTTHSVNLAGTPNVAVVWVYNQRLFGVDQTGETLSWSALNNGDSLGNAGAGGGQAVIRTFGASKLMAGAALGGVNLLLHAGGLSVFEGYTQDDISISAGTRGVTPLIDGLCPWALTPLDGALWLPTPRGVVLLDGGGATPLDTPERPDPTAGILAALPTTDLLKVRAVHSRATREVWTYLPGRGVYVWHTVLRAWTGPWDTGYLAPETTALIEAVDDTGAPCVLRGDASGWVSRCDAAGVTTDNVGASASGTSGTAVPMAWSPRRLFVADAQTGARDVMGYLAVRRGYLHADLHGSATASVTVTTPDTAVTQAFGTSGGAAYYDGTATYDGGSVYDGAGVRPYRVELAGTGPWVDVLVTDSGAATSVYAGVEIEAFALGRFR